MNRVKKYQVCKRCVMDTTDPLIEFNNEGICNHCREAEKSGKIVWFPNDEGAKKLEEMILEIKQFGKGKKYDAIIGLSGGVDSSYLAYKASKDWGLRLLAVHVDAGWNNSIAEKNVKVICDKCNIDLKIIKIDWEEMKDLQLAFLKASVPNQDIPQDHAFFANLYRYAIESNIKYVLNGGNWATECILPSSWGYSSRDGNHIKNIYSIFGNGRKLGKYQVNSLYKFMLYYPYIKKIKEVRPLNFIPFSKDVAIEEMSRELGWVYYGGKHHESIWTKFFQTYYLTEKFNYDKRKAHLSSLILSGQITREDALKELALEPFDKELIKEDIKFIANKFNLSFNEFYEILKLPPKRHEDYYCEIHSNRYKTLQKIWRVLKGRNN